MRTTKPRVSMQDARKAYVVCFGPFKLDLKAGELYKDGGKILLQEQPFRVLRILVENDGEVVTREEIRRTLWPNDTVVEFDHSINAAIKKLRLVLGDSAEKSCYIGTVARRGYRLLTPVEWLEAPPTESPSAEVRAVQPPATTQENLIGKLVSHYRVLEVLGGGGMGVVYKAEDLKLGRQVAVKLLPEELAHERIALERFEREARAASALEHPNICPIYEFGDHEGQPFIVMQLLDGQTLRERLGNTGEQLQLNELTDLAIQITDGLDAAHQKGIIHRDIKPANVFVTTRGVAKILDFGLAKVIPANSNAAASEMSTAATGELLTNPGAPLGTIAYMSPEQVSGKELDSRTDLFSFGAVLYEMCTERLPFPGETPGLIFHGILECQPLPASQSNPAVSPEFEEIIKKALEKDRDLRYQSAADIRTDLQKLKRDTKAGSPANVTTPRRTHSLPLRWRANLTLGIGGLVIVLVILAASFYRWLGHTSIGGSGLPPVHKPVTYLGDAYMPAISPDGTFVAYVAAPPEGKARLILQDLSGGNSLELLQADDIRQPRWSPVGSELMVRARDSDPAKTGLLVVSRLGGPLRSLGAKAVGRCWTPDGSRIVSATANHETDGGWIALVDKQTGAEKKIHGPGYWMLDGIDCSAKTGMLLLNLIQTSGRYEIWMMKPDGSEQRKLIEEQKKIDSPQWSPTGDAIYYLRSRGETTDLVKLSISSRSKESSVLISGLEIGDNFTLSADGSQLAYTRKHIFSNLWLAELSAPVATSKVKKKALTWGTMSNDEPSISPDGHWVAFSGGSGAKTNIYKMAVDGGQPVQLTFFDAAMSSSPAWSLGGRRIAFICDQGGTPKVWVVDSDGGTASPLDKTNASATNKRLTWFPNPEIIYQQPGMHNLRRLHLETQMEEPVLPADSKDWLYGSPNFSRDGKKFAVLWNRKPQDGLWVVTLEKYSERLLAPGSYYPLGWSPDGNLVYAVNGGPEIYQIGFADSKQPRTVTQMPGDINTGAVSSDGRKIIVSVVGMKSDVWVMEDFDPQLARKKQSHQ